MRKKKVSLTLGSELLRNIDNERNKIGLSRSAYINMTLLRKRRRRR